MVVLASTAGVLTGIDFAAADVPTKISPAAEQALNVLKNDVFFDREPVCDQEDTRTDEHPAERVHADGGRADYRLTGAGDGCTRCLPLQFTRSGPDSAHPRLTPCR
jgi:hypothetical protein